MPTSPELVQVIHTGCRFTHGCLIVREYASLMPAPPLPRVYMDKIAIISLVLILFAVITITLGIVKLHTYPGKIAEERGHPQKQAIEVTSLLGLLIFPLWMLALVWSYSGAVIGNMYAVPAMDEGADSDGDASPENDDSANEA